jgi:hypothetical protein
LFIPRIARRSPHAAGSYFNKRALPSIGGALVIAVGFALQVITAPSGAASAEGSCTVLPSGAVVCETGGGGGPGTTTTTAPPAAGPPPAHIPPYYIVLVPCDECVSGGTDEICTSHGTVGFDPNIPADWVPGDPLPDGDTFLQLEEEISSTTGQVLGVVPDSAPNAGQPCNGHAPPAPRPPLPPSPAEAWSAAVKDLPVPQIRSNPGSAGLVHLGTWFWLSNDAAGVPVSVTAAADGGSVTATVYPVSYTWDFGPPGSSPVTSYTAGSPGGASSASAVYTYVDNGTYEVSVAVNWSGSFTFDNGAPIALPVVSEVQSFPYEVREIRSVLGGVS